MKFLYVSFVSRAKQYSGILKKVAGQTDGVARLGWDARYVCADGNDVVLCGGEEPESKTIAEGLRWRGRQAATAEKICEFIAEGRYDLVYIKGFLANPYALRIADAAKSANPRCRVIYEIATYPYWGEYRRFFRVDWKRRDARAFAGHLLEAAQHWATAPRMKRSVDALVVFGQPVERLWGIPAVTIDNGVSVDRIEPRDSSGRMPGAAIRLLGVAGTSVAHGYDRVLDGLAQYRKAKPPGGPEVFFDLVGENETVRALRARTAELGLEDAVSFLGYRDSGELALLYNRCDAAVSSLGVYRIGLKWLSPLKSREYCAAGIPFLYAYEDTLPGNATFAMKIPNDPSPVDIAAVVRFVERCRGNPAVSRRERQYAEEYFDWKIIMKRVLLFVGAAGLE